MNAKESRVITNKVRESADISEYLMTIKVSANMGNSCVFIGKEIGQHQESKLKSLGYTIGSQWKGTKDDGKLWWRISW